MVSAARTAQAHPVDPVNADRHPIDSSAPGCSPAMPRTVPPVATYASLIQTASTTPSVPSASNHPQPPLTIQGG